VVFCRGFIYETRFAKGSDKSDPYNMGIFHQPPRVYRARNMELDESNTLFGALHCNFHLSYGS